MSRYRPGDVVLVRSDLSADSHVRYRMEDHLVSDVATTSMCRLRGKEVTISKCTMEKYRVEENECWWTDEMFEGLVWRPSELEGLDFSSLPELL